MTHLTVNVPARVTHAPRGADFLADAALAMFDFGHRVGSALLVGLRSRHQLAQGVIHAPSDEATCKEGIGSIKG